MCISTAITVAFVLTLEYIVKDLEKVLKLKPIWLDKDSNYAHFVQNHYHTERAKIINTQKNYPLKRSILWCLKILLNYITNNMIVRKRDAIN